MGIKRFIYSLIRIKIVYRFNTQINYSFIYSPFLFTFILFKNHYEDIQFSQHIICFFLVSIFDKHLKKNIL